MRINSIDLFKIISSYMIVIFHTTIYGMSDYFIAIATNDDIVSAAENSGLLFSIMMVRPLMQWLIASMFIISGYFLLRDENFLNLKRYYKE